MRKPELGDVWSYKNEVLLIMKNENNKLMNYIITGCEVYPGSLTDIELIDLLEQYTYRGNIREGLIQIGKTLRETR